MNDKKITFIFLEAIGTASNSKYLMENPIIKFA